jgi:hypothetical protein
MNPMMMNGGGMTPGAGMPGTGMWSPSGQPPGYGMGQGPASPMDALQGMDPGELMQLLAMRADPAQLARFSAPAMDRQTTDYLMHALMKGGQMPQPMAGAGQPY